MMGSYLPSKYSINFINGFTEKALHVGTDYHDGRFLDACTIALTLLKV